MEDSLLQVNLYAAFEEFDPALAELRQCLRAESDYPAWALGHDDPADARRANISILTQVEYVDGQQENETVSLPGLMAVSQRSYQAAEAFNAAKKRVQGALQAMDKKSVHVQVKGKISGDSKVNTLVRHALGKLGRARFQRIQASRQIVLLDSPPKMVGFFWACTRKVSKLNIDNAQVKLKKKGGGDIVEQDMQLLAALPEHEILAHVVANPIHQRANINVVGRKTPLAKACSLPILYRAEKGAPLIAFRPLSVEKPKQSGRKREADKKVEDEPYLRSIPVHRYLPEYRQA